MAAGWLLWRIAGPVVVVAGPVVVGAALVVVGPVVVGAMLVVVTSVVVDATVLVGTVVVGGAVVVDAVVVGPAVVGGAVVVGLAVVDDAVTVGWVVAPTVEGAVVVVVSPTAASVWAVPGRAVVVGPLMAPRPGPGVVDGGGSLVGSRGAAVVDVGTGLVGKVGSATLGTRRGGSGWGSSVAEATTAARIIVVSPKTNSSSFQGRCGVARCRGGGVGMVHHPGLTCSSRLKGVRGSRTLTGRKGPSSAQRIERHVPVSSGTLPLVLAGT